MAVIAGGLITARFIKEEKNRFICKIEIDGNAVECYVPSSCRLSNFFNLNGRQVLIRENNSLKMRTQYALFAVPYKRSYVLLNSLLANYVIEANIYNRRFSFLGKRSQVFREHRIEGYKADLYIAQSKTIIEIKSIISTDKTAVFPTVYSERAIKQLEELKALLQDGYKVCYIIVTLNPYIKEIIIDKDSKLFRPYNECKALGMQIKSFACRLKDNHFVIEQEISVN